MDLNSIIIFMEGRSVLDRENFHSDDKFILECLRQLKSYKDAEEVLFRPKHVVTTSSTPLKNLFGPNINDEKYIDLKNKFRLQMLMSGATHVISSMSLSSDLIFALAAIDLKNTGHDVRLECVLPFKDHYKKWKKEYRSVVEYILEHTDMITYTSEEFSSEVFEKQSSYILKKIDEIIYLDAPSKQLKQSGKKTTLLKIS